MLYVFMLTSCLQVMPQIRVSEKTKKLADTLLEEANNRDVEIKTMDDLILRALNNLTGMMYITIPTNADFDKIKEAMEQFEFTPSSPIFLPTDTCEHPECPCGKPKREAVEL